MVTDAIVTLLLKDHAEKINICKATPVYIDKNVEFICDTSNFIDPRDISLDLTGFVRTKTKNFYYIDESNYVKDEPSIYEFVAKRYIYTHKEHKDFHKVILTITYKGESRPYRFAYLQYYFEGDEHQINFLAGKDKTTFSNREKIKSLASEGLRGKQILTNMGQTFETSRTILDAPLSLATIYNNSRNESRSEQLSKEVLELIDMCIHENETNNAFLRQVITSPEFSVFLSNDRQLNDVKRFCADTSFSVFGVDPTFNICQHISTFSCYRHPMLVVKGTNVHPVMIGPSIIHTSKTFASYHTLPATMVKLCPELAGIKTFGTDDEVNVYEALKSTFQSGNHLLCTIHVRDNLIKLFNDKKIDNISDYMRELFGLQIGETKIKGLIDSESEEEFEEKWLELTKIWEQRKGGKIVLEYILKNKKEKMKKKMLLPVRRSCNLGNDEYDQNANESANSVVKKARGHAVLSVKEAIALVRTQVNHQDERIKMALLGTGADKNSTDWEVAPGFERFKVSNECYYKMTDKQKAK